MSQPQRNENPSEQLSFDELFAKFGESQSDRISLENINKWLKQANLIEEFITLDTTVAFAQAGKGNKKLTKEEFREMLDKLAKEKKKDVQEILQKLADAGPPSPEKTTTFTGGSVDDENTERRTNTSTFTGIQKERIDEESRGRDMEGRSDAADADGYKNKDTYGSQDGEKDEEKEGKPMKADAKKKDGNDKDEK